MDPETLPRTGFGKLDNRARAPRNHLGDRFLTDPTANVDVKRYGPFHRALNEDLPLDRIEAAYRADSFVRQGIHKYVELCTKHGWDLDCATAEPRDYLLRRFDLFYLATGKSFQKLVREGVADFIKFANCFWVKQRSELDYPGFPRRGAGDQEQPVAGYFRADPRKMLPRWDESGRKLLGWDYYPKNRGKVEFSRADVVHLCHSVPPGELFGSPDLLPVLDDVLEYRRCEEYVIKLLFKYLNPIIHHEVPDLSGIGGGRQEDVDIAYAAYTVKAPDGIIITPPGHKMNILGAESHALRGEGYMEMLRDRVWAGLGVNGMVMGQTDGVGIGTADAMTTTMHNRAKFYHQELADQLDHHVLFELLIEGGYDPLAKDDRVSWMWNSFETESEIKVQNHEIDKMLANGITHDEFRRNIGMKPLSPEDEKRLYVYMAKIPEIEAAADAKARAGVDGGPAAAVRGKDRPSNQSGSRGAPKIRPT